MTLVPHRKSFKWRLRSAHRIIGYLREVAYVLKLSENFSDGAESKIWQKPYHCNRAFSFESLIFGRINYSIFDSKDGDPNVQDRFTTS